MVDTNSHKLNILMASLENALIGIYRHKAFFEVLLFDRLQNDLFLAMGFFSRLFLSPFGHFRSWADDNGFDWKERDLIGDGLCDLVGFLCVVGAAVYLLLLVLLAIFELI